MRNFNATFHFEDDFQWKNLEKIFPDIFHIIKGSKKISQEEEVQIQVKYELNMKEIEKNRKPFGFTSDECEAFLVFPVDQKKMIIGREMPSDRIQEFSDEISKVLKAKKIKFKVTFDDMLMKQVIKQKK